MAESETTYLCSVLLAMAGLVVVATIHIMAWIPADLPTGVKQGIYNHSAESNWKYYDLEIIDVDWMFPTWMVIYGLQAFWLLYSVIALCRETKLGSLIINPPIMPSSMFYSFLIGLACTIGWVVVWDIREYSAYASILIMGAAIFISLTAAVSLHAVKLYANEVSYQGHGADVWAIRFIVHNCTTAYVAWTTIITSYNICMIIYWFELLEKNIAEVVMLGVMMGYVIIWMVLDIFATRELTACIVLPYFVMLIPFGMPIVKYYRQTEATGEPFLINEMETNAKVCCVFAAITAVICIIKLIVAFAFCCCTGKEVQVEDEFGAIEYREDASVVDVNEVMTGQGDERANAVSETTLPAPY